jgi:CRP/FNR family transcriptional regulator
MNPNLKDTPSGRQQIEQLTRELHLAFPILNHPALVEEMIEVGQIMHVKAGDVLIDFGEFIRMVPLVLDGAIKVLRENEEGDELFLYFLGKGESCSMSFTCCMSDKRSSIRAVAEEDTRLLAIPIQYIDTWITKYTVWKNFILQSYDLRLIELIRTIDSIAFKKLDERLLEYLSNLALKSGSVEIQITHQQIASDLNASREAVSRLLKQLEKMHRLQLGRNRIKLMES